MLSKIHYRPAPWTIFMSPDVRPSPPPKTAEHKIYLFIFHTRHLSKKNNVHTHISLFPPSFPSSLTSPNVTLKMPTDTKKNIHKCSKKNTTTRTHFFFFLSSWLLSIKLSRWIRVQTGYTKNFLRLTFHVVKSSALKKAKWFFLRVFFLNSSSLISPLVRTYPHISSISPLSTFLRDACSPAFTLILAQEKKVNI